MSLIFICDALIPLLRQMWGGGGKVEMSEREQERWMDIREREGEVGGGGRKQDESHVCEGALSWLSTRGMRV